ncbi:MAG TPA: short chain dehydrogenase [Verrucomicrobia bacterium]|nr:short chain dehydrogenase [Verrucomicrobiota bacterium]
MTQFKNKVAIVTGGGLGIGQATAIEFSKEGATVVIANRNAKEGQQTVSLIQEMGGIATFIQTDVTKERDVRNLVDQTLGKYGRLDYAFNNAGIEQKPMPLPEQSEELFDTVMDVNVKGVWLCMKYQIPAMLKNGGGSIVNTSSFSGAIAFATIPIYVASKHAVVGLTKAIALEYARAGIRVNAVLPGAVGNTGTLERSFGGNQEALDQVAAIHPMGRLATKTDIANTVIFLCSDKAAFITGQPILVDGGYTAG